MAALAELGSEIKAIGEKVGPSVVGIGNRWRGGSGVVLEDGLILTNAHNLHGDEVSVTFADGREVTATVRGLDADGDVAVLAADTAGVAALAWADGAAPASGDPVVALGRRAGRPGADSRRLCAMTNGRRVPQLPRPKVPPRPSSVASAWECGR